MTLNDQRHLVRNGKPRANESVRTLLWVGMPKAGTIQKKYRRGVTLFEVLIVVAIMALIASGVATKTARRSIPGEASGASSAPVTM